MTTKRELKACYVCCRMFPEEDNRCPSCGVTRKMPMMELVKLMFLLMMVLGSIGSLFLTWWFFR